MKSSRTPVAIRGLIVAIIAMTIVAFPFTASAKENKKATSTSTKTTPVLKVGAPDIFRIDKVVEILASGDTKIAYTALQKDGSWAISRESLIRGTDHFEGQLFVGVNPPQLITFRFYSQEESKILLDRIPSVPPEDMEPFKSGIISRAVATVRTN